MARSNVEVDRENLTLSGERKIRDTGNSAAITIPPELLQGTGLEVDDDVELRADMEEGVIYIRRPDAEPDADADADADTASADC